MENRVKVRKIVADSKRFLVELMILEHGLEKEKTGE